MFKRASKALSIEIHAAGGTLERRLTSRFSKAGRKIHTSINLNFMKMKFFAELYALRTGLENFT